MQYNSAYIQSISQLPSLNQSPQMPGLDTRSYTSSPLLGIVLLPYTPQFEMATVEAAYSNPRMLPEEEAYLNPNAPFGDGIL